MMRGLIIAGFAALMIGALLFSQRGGGPLKVSGVIEADEVRIGSRVGGRVRTVEAEEGTVVKAGEVLVELEPFNLLERRAEAEKTLEGRKAEYQRTQAGFRPEEVAEAKARRDQLAARLERLVNGPRPQEIAIGQAQLELADAESQLAQLQYDRARSLAARNATTQEELDRASSVLKKAKSMQEVRREELAQLKEGTRREEVAEAQAQLAEADQAWKLRSKGSRDEDIAQAKASMESAQAVLRSIDRQIEELSIKAPIDGVVEAVDLHPGDLVGADAPVIALLDMRHLWVRAYVPENRMSQKIGEKVQVTVDSFPDERFSGHLSFVAREAEFTPSNVQTPEERSKQVFRIKVELDDGLDRLRPGMSADVWFEGS